MAKETKNTVPPEASSVVAYDWTKTGVTGFEATRQEDLGIPFLSILQDLSPQIRKTDPNYATKKIEGAQPGDVINTLANKVVYTHGRDPLQFIPCYHEKLFVEWKANRGGFVKAHKNAAVLQETKPGKDGPTMANGNIIMETSYFYGFALIEGAHTPVIIGMSSAALKTAREWLNLMMGIRLDGPNGKFNPPAFSHVYNLETMLRVKDQNSWMAWKISVKGQLSDPTLIEKSIEMAKSSAASARTALPPAAESDDIPI